MSEEKKGGILSLLNEENDIPPIKYVCMYVYEWLFASANVLLWVEIVFIYVCVKYLILINDDFSWDIFSMCIEYLVGILNIVFI